MAGSDVGYDGLFIAFHYSWYFYLPYVQMFFDNGYDNCHMFKYDVQIIRYVNFQKTYQAMLAMLANIHCFFHCFHDIS